MSALDKAALDLLRRDREAWEEWTAKWLEQHRAMIELMEKKVAMMDEAVEACKPPYGDLNDQAQRLALLVEVHDATDELEEKIQEAYEALRRLRQSLGGRAVKYNRTLQDEVNRLVELHPRATVGDVWERLSTSSFDNIYRDGDRVFVGCLDDGTEDSISRVSFKRYVTRSRSRLRSK